MSPGRAAVLLAPALAVLAYGLAWGRYFTSEDFLLVRFLGERPPWRDPGLWTERWLGVTVVGFYRPFRRAPVPREAQGPTVVVPSASPVATAIAQEAAIEALADPGDTDGDGLCDGGDDEQHGTGDHRGAASPS